MFAISFLLSYLAYEFSGECVVSDALEAAIKIQIEDITVEVSVQVQLVISVTLMQRMEEERKWSKQRSCLCTFSPGGFQPFSILDIGRISYCTTELYIQYLGTAHPLCINAGGGSQSALARWSLLLCPVLGEVQTLRFQASACRRKFYFIFIYIIYLYFIYIIFILFISAFYWDTIAELSLPSSVPRGGTLRYSNS